MLLSQILDQKESFACTHAQSDQAPVVSCLGAKAVSFQTMLQFASANVTLFEVRNPHSPSYAFKDSLQAELSDPKPLVLDRDPHKAKNVVPYVLMFWRGDVDFTNERIHYDMADRLVGWAIGKLGEVTTIAPGMTDDVITEEQQLELCHFQIDPAQCNKGYGAACLAAVSACTRFKIVDVINR